MLTVNVHKIKEGNYMQHDKNSIGYTIGKLRKAQGMSRAKLAETVGISDSHMDKIEVGLRNPGIDTYRKILDALNASIIIKKECTTIKERCGKKVYNIIELCSDEQALFLTMALEHLYEDMKNVLC